MPSHGCRKESYRNPSRFFRQQKLVSSTFSSFPYLSTCVFPALYNINLLPSNWAESTLINIARLQVRANRLPACLVLDWSRALWFDADGSESWKTFIPKGGAILSGRLKLPSSYSFAGMEARQELLDNFSSISRKGRGYIVGDPKSCVRDATLEDARLGDLTGNTIPIGLIKCPVCGDLKGECLYPESGCYNDKVWKATCRCENNNLCAACGNSLFHHKLDSCYFDADTHSILHVAGYLAITHQC